MAMRSPRLFGVCALCAFPGLALIRASMELAHMGRLCINQWKQA